VEKQRGSMTECSLGDALAIMGPEQPAEQVRVLVLWEPGQTVNSAELPDPVLYPEVIRMSIFSKSDAPRLPCREEPALSRGKSG